MDLEELARSMERLLEPIHAFYEYLGSLSNGDALRADMVLVDNALGALGFGKNDPQASVAAYRLAEVAKNAPLCAEEVVKMFNQLGETLVSF
jgi:hypothetical protein